MASRIDLTGRRFGKLLVVEWAPKSCDRRGAWNCLCDCGKPHRSTGSALTDGRCGSCGCSKAMASAEASAARFWSRIDKNGPVPAHRPELGPCWLWVGATQTKGYGRVWFRGIVWGTHRLAWFLTHGEVPEDKQVCHHCDNPPCCRPSHHFLGTNQENVADMLRKGRYVVGNRPLGAAVHSARLTEANVVEIRRRYDGSRASVLQLAAAFSVTPQNIKSIVDGRTWRHVERAS